MPDYTANNELTLYWGRTTSNGNAGKTTLVDSALISRNDFITNTTLILTSGDSNLEKRDVTAFDSVTGTITVDSAFSAQIVSGVTFKIIGISPADAETAAISADIGDASSSTLGSIYGILGNPATNLATQIAAIQTDIGDPSAQTDSIYAQARHINKLAVDVTTPPIANTLADTLHKDGNFTYDNTTDSLEAISDLVVVADAAIDAVQADVGDPSASGDTLYAQVRHINKFPVNVTTPPIANTLADTIHKDGNYTFDNTTDSLEAISDKIGTPASTVSADLAVVDGYHDVPAQDAVTNAQIRDVVGNKTDTTGGNSLVALVKTADAAIDAVQTDLGNPSARTNLQTIEAMLGNPDTAAKSLWNEARHINTTPIDGSSVPTANTLADILHKNGSYTFDNTTDSLEAISDLVTAANNDVDALQADLNKFIIADQDNFDKADADANTERWDVAYTNGSEGGSADISTTTAGKLMVKADPDVTPTAAEYSVLTAQPAVSKYATWIVDVDCTFGSDNVSQKSVSLQISKGAAFDAQNRIYIQKQDGPTGNRITTGAYLNNVLQTEVHYSTEDNTIAFKIERLDNVWRTYYSLAQSPDYVWVLLAQYEDPSEYVTARTIALLSAYSPGAADDETVQGDFDNFRYYIGVAGLQQAVAGDYDSSHIAADADGSSMERQEWLQTEMAKVPKSDGAVTWNATALASINAEVDTALNTAIPGGATADSINERIKALDDAYTAARAAYLDNINQAGLLQVTALRAGYLDNLSAGAVALASVATAARLAELDAGNLPADVDTIKADTQTIEDSTLKAAPTAGSLAAYIASGGVGLGTQLPNSKSLYDVIVLDRLDHGTYGLSAIETLVDDLEGAVGAIEGATTLHNKLTAARAALLDQITALRMAELDAANLPADIDQIKADTDKISDATLPAAPTAGSLARFIASGGTALGTQLPDSKSLYDGMSGGIDAVNRLAGKTQVLEVSVTSAANAGDVTLATITTQPVIIDSIVVHADAAQTANMTSCGVFGGAGKVITFIDAATAVQANLNAADKQVAWAGAVRLAATKTIVISLAGTGAIAVDLTVTITYKAAVNGGYLA